MGVECRAIAGTIWTCEDRILKGHDSSRAAHNTAFPSALQAAENSILPLVLKGHGFSRADKVNQISVGFSRRGTYFRVFGEIQPFPQPV